MTPNEYLHKVIKSQTLSADSDELKALRDRRDEIEDRLRETFGSTPTIRYGGSQAKGTLVKESYDLDIVCYFPHEEDEAGETLDDIFNNVKSCLEEGYLIKPKTSALRILGTDKVDFHVDVVPGRFVDDEEKDTFLYRAIGDKSRLKTNIDVHIAHVKDSGVTDAIKLLKLWRTRNALDLKTFILELITVDLIGGSKDKLDEQLKQVLEKLRDEPENITVKDPANPSGNDLSEIWNDTIRSNVAALARSTLETIESLGWEAVFGEPPDDDDSKTIVDALKAAASTIQEPTRPWQDLR